ncbi:MAG: hypothetical protein RRA39_06185 [Cyanobacteriota bacterium PSP.bin.10]|nr:hypothetical protein [Cyanobacteriota bacterium PSP.bin.10]
MSAPTIPPLPTPNPSPSIVGLPPGPLAAPTFTKSFDPSTTSPNAPVTLRFTITNNSGIQLTGLNFADNLPAGLVVATPPNFTNTCGGSFAPTSGAALITLSGGTLAANATCTVTVQVVAAGTGTYTNPAVTLTSNQAPAVQSAPVNLSVNPVTAPAFAKSFSPSTTSAGVPVTLSFSITNNSGIQLTGLNFADNLPAGLVVATPPNFTNTCGGSFAPTSGAALITLSGGTLAANATCTVTVQVVAAGTGTYTNPAVTLTSNQAPAVQSTPVNLSVISVPAPTFNKQFVPNSTQNGNVVAVVFTITNTATVPITGLSFIDILPNVPPPGLQITTPAVTSNTCGGTLTANAGTTAISLAGGSLAAGASCVVSVSVEQALPLPVPPVQYDNPPVTLLSNGAPPVQSNQASVTFN